MDTESRLLFFVATIILLCTVFVNFYFQQEYSVELHYDKAQGAATSEPQALTTNPNTLNSLSSAEETPYEASAFLSEEVEQPPEILVVQFPLNINRCTKEELLLVPGVGEVLAQRILQYRDVLQGYTELEQLMEIKGIGEGTYAEIEPYLVADVF